MRELVTTIDVDVINGDIGVIHDIVGGLKQMNDDYECAVINNRNDHGIITGAHIIVYRQLYV